VFAFMTSKIKGQKYQPKLPGNTHGYLPETHGFQSYHGRSPAYRQPFAEVPVTTRADLKLQLQIACFPPCCSPRLSNHAAHKSAEGNFKAGAQNPHHARRWYIDRGGTAE
jgi:hypothetical protein